MRTNRACYDRVDHRLTRVNDNHSHLNNQVKLRIIIIYIYQFSVFPFFPI